MNPYVLMAVGSFICALIQGVDSFLSLRERFKQQSSGANMASDNHRSGWLAGSLVIGAVGSAIIGTALLMYHPQPVTVEKTVTVEKPILCPPSQTGAATSKGTNSPATSGTGNTITYGTLPPPKKP
jgi:hypothetical protein